MAVSTGPKRYPRVVAGLAVLKVNSVVLDGEGACLEEDGLCTAAGTTTARFYWIRFLELTARTLEGRPLFERNKALKKLLGERGGALQYVEHLKGDCADDV